MLTGMLWQKVSSLLGAGSGGVRVVDHQPGRRALLLVLLAGVVVATAGLGFWLGRATSALDRTYLETLEVRHQASDARAATLTRQLADARLAQSIDAQAAQSLRDTVGELRGEVAGLREEVTFYKSLMAPSELNRGLQIADFELARGKKSNTFTYRLLLTQARERRQWVQGKVEMQVQGLRAAAEGPAVQEVLALTDLQEVETYPLRFRFRYFQDFSGTVTLPEGFQPQAVLVTVTPKGRSADAAQRSFGWTVQAG